MRILLIEDDARVASHIVGGLSELGHTVEHESDGRDGLYRVAADRFDVVILDRTLPRVDGLTILKTMRAAGNAMPVLILSALGTVEERVKGLRSGSEDYMAKPFAIAELAARVEIIGRRPPSAPGASAIVVEDLEIDLMTRDVRRGGRRIELTNREFRLLEYMARHAGNVLTRTMILEAVWDYSFDPQTNVVDQHISHLRQKIDAGAVPLIQTIRSVGYSLRAE